MFGRIPTQMLAQRRHARTRSGSSFVSLCRIAARSNVPSLVWETSYSSESNVLLHLQRFWVLSGGLASSLTKTWHLDQSRNQAVETPYVVHASQQTALIVFAHCMMQYFCDIVERYLLVMCIWASSLYSRARTVLPFLREHQRTVLNTVCWLCVFFIEAIVLSF